MAFLDFLAAELFTPGACRRLVHLSAVGGIAQLCCTEPRCGERMLRMMHWPSDTRCRDACFVGNVGIQVGVAVQEAFPIYFQDHETMLRRTEFL